MKVVPRIGVIKCKTELRFFGLRRSGNHAIINWLMPMLGKNVYHINDVHPYKDNLCRLYKNCKMIKDKPNDADSVIVSYENVNLSEPWTTMDIESDQIIHMLLLRDPYNTLASIFNNSIAVKNPNFRVPQYNFKEMWHNYAKEFIGNTNYLPDDTIKVNFNKWFVNKQYREEITKSAGLEINDSNINKMSDYGGGSSFDLMKYNGRAQSMDVLTRWTKFRNSQRYWRELKGFQKFSEEIFGKICEIP